MSECSICSAPQSGVPDCKDHNHWYAATKFYWTVAATKEEVIKKLAAMAIAPGYPPINKDGIEALVCKVHLPITAHYQIREYLPYDVKRDPAVKVKILNKSGKFTE